MNHENRLTREAGNLLRNRFAGEVFTVTAGMAGAQLITLGFSPFITRLYGPEAFGALGIFVAMAALVTPVATLSYDLAVVLPASDEEARVIGRAAARVGFVLSACLLVIVLLFGREIAGLFDFSLPHTYLLLLPVVLLLAGLEQVLIRWLVRKRLFRGVSTAKLGQATFAGAAMTGLGLVSPVAPFLLLSNVVGRAVNATLLWLSARPTLRGGATDTRNTHNAPDTRAVLRMYTDFPRYRAPQQLLQSTSNSVAPLLLAALFGPVATGFYALSQRVLAVPGALVAGSVGTVLLPRLAARAQAGGSLRAPVLKATAGLGILGLLPFGVIVLWGPELFGLVFGSEWTASGEYSRWLSLWLYFNFAGVPCGQAAPVLGLQRQLLGLEIASVAARGAGLLIGAMALNSVLAAVAMFSVAGAALQAVRIIWVLARSSGPVHSSYYRGSGESSVPSDDA